MQEATEMAYRLIEKDEIFIYKSITSEHITKYFSVD